SRASARAACRTWQSTRAFPSCSACSPRKPSSRLCSDPRRAAATRAAKRWRPRSKWPTSSASWIHFMPGEDSISSQRLASGARSLARKLAMQALYRWQINDAPWQDLVSEFATEEGMDRADSEYFRELVQGVHGTHAALDAELATWMDRSPALLDPIEHAVLLIGAFELKSRPEVPFRVVINEGVSLAKKFGATDGHKFVNAVLDRAARQLRPHEH